jgi:predicted MFS family arabinose efflux permease
MLNALAIGLVAACAFVVWQFKSEHAIVPPRLFRSRRFVSGNTASLLLFMSMMGTLVFMAQFFQIVHGVSASGAGERMLPWTIALFAAMPMAGALAGRFGERPLAVAGMLLQAAGLGWMSTLTSADHVYLSWVVPMILAGVGIAMSIPSLQSAVLGAVAPADIGKASGLFNTMRQLGWACGAAAAVAVFSRFGNLTQPHSMSMGFSAVLTLTATLSAMGAAVSLQLGRPEIISEPVESMSHGSGKPVAEAL